MNLRDPKLQEEIEMAGINRTPEGWKETVI